MTDTSDEVGLLFALGSRAGNPRTDRDNIAVMIDLRELRVQRGALGHAVLIADTPALGLAVVLGSLVAGFAFELGVFNIGQALGTDRSGQADGPQGLVGNDGSAVIVVAQILIGCGQLDNFEVITSADEPFLDVLVILAESSGTVNAIGNGVGRAHVERAVGVVTGDRETAIVFPVGVVAEGTSAQRSGGLTERVGRRGREAGHVRADILDHVVLTGIAAAATDLAAVLVLQRVDRHHARHVVGSVLRIEHRRGVVLAAQRDSTEATIQASEGLTVGDVTAGIGITTKLKRENRLQAVAQRFFTLEANARTIQAAVLDTGEVVVAGIGTGQTVVGIAIDEGLVDQAIARNVGLGKSSAGNQAGNCQSDDFLLLV